MNRARSFAKAALGGLLVGSGAARWWCHQRRRLRGPAVHFVGLHRVVDRVDTLGPDVLRPLCISTRTLEGLVTTAQRHFEVLSLEDAVDVLRGMRRVRRDVVSFTFDDAYRDVFLRALPILRRHAVPATVFVPTGYIDSDRPLLHDRLFALLSRARRERRDLCAAVALHPIQRVVVRVESVLERSGPEAALDLLFQALPATSLERLNDRLESLLGPAATILDEGARVMTAGELRACCAGGIQLGAHTRGHTILTHEPIERVRFELERPRRELEALTGKPCRFFAYCNGRHSAMVRDAVRRAGYTAAITTFDAPNHRGQDPFLLHRKVLCEAHTLGPMGGFSPSLAVTHLHDLFGAIGLTTPVDGEEGATIAQHRASAQERWPWPRSA